MIVVSDTSAISGLFIIDELWILSSLYSNVIMPEAVYDELAELERFGYDISIIKEAKWLQVAKIRNPEKVNELLDLLDIGEAEAIVLANELKADWLLIDETKGRKIAQTQGIQTIGLLGVLLLAKREGIIEAIKPFLDKLTTVANFRVAGAVYRQVLLSFGTNDHLPPSAEKLSAHNSITPHPNSTFLHEHRGRLFGRAAARKRSPSVSSALPAVGASHCASRPLRPPRACALRNAKAESRSISARLFRAPRSDFRAQRCAQAGERAAEGGSKRSAAMSVSEPDSTR